MSMAFNLPFYVYAILLVGIIFYYRKTQHGEYLIMAMGLVLLMVQPTLLFAYLSNLTEQSITENTIRFLGVTEVLSFLNWWGKLLLGFGVINAGFFYVYPPQTDGISSFSIFKMMGLSLVTFGLYPIFWMFHKYRILQASKLYLFRIVLLLFFWCTIVYFFFNLPIVVRRGSLWFIPVMQFAYWIVLVFTSFHLIEKVHPIVGRHWFNKIYTFLFGVFHIQYVVNQRNAYKEKKRL